MLKKFFKGGTGSTAKGTNKVSKYQIKIQNGETVEYQTEQPTTQQTKSNPPVKGSNWQSYVYPSGDLYEGDWKDSKKHGKGLAVYVDGNRYEGEWRDDAKHGRGTITFADGTSYAGEWKRDKKCGNGSAIFSSGNRYVGEWHEDNMDGHGTFYYSTGEKYEGEWVKSRISGQGVWTATDGETQYSGEWKCDLRHGRGKLHKDGVVFVVKYHNGTLQSAIPEENYKAPANDPRAAGETGEASSSSWSAAELGLPAAGDSNPTSGNTKKKSKQRERENSIDNGNTTDSSDVPTSKRPQSRQKPSRPPSAAKGHQQMAADTEDPSAALPTANESRRPGTASGGSRPGTSSKKRRHQNRNHNENSEEHDGKPSTAPAVLQTTTAPPPPPPDWLQTNTASRTKLARPGSAVATEGRNLKPMPRVLGGTVDSQPAFGKPLALPMGRSGGGASDATALANDLDIGTNTASKQQMENDDSLSASPWSLRPFLDSNGNPTTGDTTAQQGNSTSGASEDFSNSSSGGNFKQTVSPPATPQQPQRPSTASRPGTATGRDKSSNKSKQHFLPPLAGEEGNEESQDENVLPPLPSNASNSNSISVMQQQETAPPKVKRRKKKKKQQQPNAELSQEEQE